MHRWGVDGSAVDHENLNSTYACEAIVDSGIGTASGVIFPTIAAAVAAGAKDILVLDRGTAYSGNLTITLDGTRIVSPTGLVRSATAFTAGARVAGTITVNASSCVFENIAAQPASGNGWLINGDDNELLRCGVSNASNYAVYASGVSRLRILRGQFLGGPSSNYGIRVGADAADSGFSGISVIDNYLYGIRSSALQLRTYGASDTSAARYAVFESNVVEACATVSGNAVLISPAVNAVFRANTTINNGTTGASANGIYVNAPTSSPAGAVVIENNICIGNEGYGIYLSSASNRVALLGNIVHSNGVGNYGNCASCPGYATAQTNIP